MQRVILCWRDIPSQVIIKKRRERGTVQLSSRFQEAIDRAAMRAGKGRSDEYMADWCRHTSEVAGQENLQLLARQEADCIESQYSDDDLTQLVAELGFKVD